MWYVDVPGYAIPVGAHVAGMQLKDNLGPHLKIFLDSKIQPSFSNQL